mgnify:CR=1 FL=1
MRVFNKMTSVLLSVLLAAVSFPSFAFAGEGLDASTEESLSVPCEDRETADALSGVSEYSDDGVAARVDSLSSLAYVIIEEQKIDFRTDQTVVIGFSDENKEVENAQLLVENAISGEQHAFGFEKAVPGAVLFSFSGGELGEGAYRLALFEYSDASNGEESRRIDFIDDEESDYIFFVEEAAEGDGGSDAEEDSVSVYALSANGALDAQESVEAAIASAESAAPLVNRSSDGGESMVVALDPGHGGYDGGAQGHGLSEKDINLSIAEYCKAELERYYGVTVFMTRTTDEYVGLTERVDRAVAAGADVFVSLHTNSSTASSAHGAEVIVPNDGSYYYQETHIVGTQLGEKILAQITALGISERSVYSKDATNGYEYADGSLGDYFTVIAEAREHGIPGIIVEHAFISNPGDASFLGDENNLRALGVADATGIAQQYGLRILNPLYGFSDVYEVTPHVQEIGWLASAGVSSGYGDGTFRPYEAVARCDMAAFLYRMAGSPAYEPSASDMARFSDVDASTPHAKEVWWLASAGVSSGYGDGTFRPYESVARCDMAAFLYRIDLRLNREDHFSSPKTIMGASIATAEQMVAYFQSTGKEFPSDVYGGKGASTIGEFAQIVVEEANFEGVRAEVVFCQAMKETGWLQFGGQVQADQCNFAGLGATNGGAAGASFENVRMGIRAQVQHLKAYASTDPLKHECVDPRFDLVDRGCAPLVTDLNGRWAVPGDGYGERILAMIDVLLAS